MSCSPSAKWRQAPLSGGATSRRNVIAPLRCLRRLSTVATAPQLKPRCAGRTRAAVAGRAALLRKLASAVDARLVVIVAPPGYGKSTLLAEWAAHDNRRFVWIPLTDSTPGAAQPMLAEAIRSATQAIRLSGVPCVVVLEDAHLAEAETLRRIVDEAMLQLPAGSALALASRREPMLPLGRMRAHRTVVEVRIDDLALTSAEAAPLLRGAGLELDFGVVQTL